MAPDPLTASRLLRSLLPSLLLRVPSVARVLKVPESGAEPLRLGSRLRPCCCCVRTAAAAAAATAAEGVGAGAGGKPPAAAARAARARARFSPASCRCGDAAVAVAVAGRAACAALSGELGPRRACWALVPDVGVWLGWAAAAAGELAGL